MIPIALPIELLQFILGWRARLWQLAPNSRNCPHCNIIIMISSNFLLSQAMPLACLRKKISFHYG